MPDAKGAAAPNDIGSAALRGATLAFAARTGRPSAPTASNNSHNNNNDAARKAAVIAGRPRTPESRQNPGSLQRSEDDSPSKGSSVRDRIKLFSDEGDSNSSSSPSLDRRSTANPQHVAAQFAVDRSMARAAAEPPTKTSGDVHRGLHVLGEGGPNSSAAASPAAVQQDESTCTSSSASRGRCDGYDPSCSFTPSVNVQQQQQQPRPRPSPPCSTLASEESWYGRSVRDEDSILLLSPTPASRPLSAGQASPAPIDNDLSSHARAGVRSTPAHGGVSPVHQTIHSSVHDGAPDSPKSSMSDARVASSLASSRSASPSKQNAPPPPPPPPPRHRLTRSRTSLHPPPTTTTTSRSDNSRTPSPVKGLRKTLRDESKSDDESERARQNNHHHRRRRIIRPHPHKHNEGGRKRWRNAVTESERKRYEGVWAANKGLLLGSDSILQDMVVNVVVRDIWSRSRLSPNLLAQIWDLVSNDAEAMVLSREEFVVGMWLIDQCLRGHKIPWKVSQSVWESVQHIPRIRSSAQVPKFRR